MTRPETTPPPTQATPGLARARPLSGTGLSVYLLLGIYFGIVITKTELVSWFRIQEMFRFQSFHMYGVIGSALVVGASAIAFMKSRRMRTLGGDEVVVPPKELGQRGSRYWIGGTFFGLGWALAGACPGPIFALIGNGVSVYWVVLLSALLGTWAYGALRPHLPHA
jgi:uncharacterized membrane protein YedE/YeeE